MSFHQDQRLRLIRDDLDLGQALAQAEKVSRRTGAMLLVDAEDRLSGILTDADLRRALLARRQENLLAAPVCELMTPQPKHIHVGQLASEALAILNQFRIDELPVVDDDHHPVGVIDVQDLLGIKTFSHVRD
jgi:arabinose-5-phosphate isomerase